jgi:hypothetical protein
MKEVDELIGVFGATRAQVMGNIVEYFFNDEKNNSLINRLKERKRNQNEPDEKLLESLIINLLKGTNSMPLEQFLKQLNIGEKYFYEHNHIWSEKYKYIFKDLKIIKKE